MTSRTDFVEMQETHVGRKYNTGLDWTGWLVGCLVGWLVCWVD